MSFTAKMLTGSTITAIVDSKPYQVGLSHPNYEMLLEAYRNNDSEMFVSLVNENKGVEAYVQKDSKGNETGITVKKIRFFIRVENFIMF
jgi:hypothetical protein